MSLPIFNDLDSEEKARLKHDEKKQGKVVTRNNEEKILSMVFGVFLTMKYEVLVLIYLFI